MQGTGSALFDVWTRVGRRRTRMPLHRAHAWGGLWVLADELVREITCATERHERGTSQRERLRAVMVQAQDAAALLRLHQRRRAA